MVANPTITSPRVESAVDSDLEAILEAKHNPILPDTLRTRCRRSATDPPSAVVTGPKSPGQSPDFVA